MPVESTVRRRNDTAFGLIETLRFEPEAGCIRADRHLDRLTASSDFFHRRFERKQAEQLLSSIQSDAPLRVRLFLDENDQLSCSTHSFVPVPSGAVWRLAIAATRLDSTDQYLAHKTSRRGHYDAARAEFATSKIDEVLLENEKGHVCEGTITTIFVKRDGKLVTPHISHGLLKGVLRQEMLDQGEAIEGDIRRSDLTGAELFVGNSLRGLIRAEMVDIK